MPELNSHQHLLATSRPARSLLQPARSSCHGSQVSPPPQHHAHTRYTPLRAPPKLQHYPHLLHHYAVPCFCQHLASCCLFAPPAEHEEPKRRAVRRTRLRFLKNVQTYRLGSAPEEGTIRGVDVKTVGFRTCLPKGFVIVAGDIRTKIVHLIL